MSILVYMGNFYIHELSSLFVHFAYSWALRGAFLGERSADVLVKKKGRDDFERPRNVWIEKTNVIS